ncbi:MAG TPA: glycosyltransferase family 9 protein, partial [Ignavibacteriaceae bacterium]|nr:glycosyltransferase family 9 protein [Ignavibacteriaceae bacterium]
WNYFKYKFNLIYRIKFLLLVRGFGFKYCYNLTAGRGVTVDELALLSGAEFSFALNTNFRFLRNLYGKFMNKKYTEIISTEHSSEFEKHLQVLRKLGIHHNSPRTSLYIDDLELIKAKKILTELDVENYIVISPFSDLNIKNWNIDKYRELVLKIVNQYQAVTILFIGNTFQKEKISKSFEVNQRLINLAGSLSIIESTAILNNALLFIGNDSGFTHIAKALEIPTIAIIGGGSNGYFFPYGSDDKIVYLYSPQDCFRCEWRCIHKIAFCLQEVKVDDVFREVRKIIQNDGNEISDNNTNS